MFKKEKVKKHEKTRTRVLARKDQSIYLSRRVVGLPKNKEMKYNILSGKATIWLRRYRGLFLLFKFACMKLISTTTLLRVSEVLEYVKKHQNEQRLGKEKFSRKKERNPIYFKIIIRSINQSSW